MSDLHELLKTSIIDRGISDSADREAIYLEAREAVVRRLEEHNPPLEPHDIDERIAAFDDSVAMIEEDLLNYFEPQQAAPATAPTRAVPVRAPYADEPAAPGEGDLYYPEDETDYPPTERPPGEGEGEGEVERNLDYDDAEEATDGQGGQLGQVYEDEPAEHDEEIYDAPLGYDGDDGYEDDSYDGDAEAGYEAPPQADRWTQPRTGGVGPKEALPPVQALRRVTESTKIWLLVGAITSLLVALGGLALVLFPSPEDGVTVAIDQRRRVSDAATALRIAAEVLPVRQSFVIFDGLDPTIFETPASNPVRFDRDESGNFARVSSSASASAPRVVIGPGLATRLAGQEVRVRVVVRSSRELGAVTMRMAYQSGVAISHWQTVNLDPGYAEVGIRWRVPSLRTSVAGDYLVIEPGIPGDGTGADIRSVEVDILEPSR